VNRLNKAIRHSTYLLKRMNGLSIAHADHKYYKTLYAKEAERAEFVLKLLKDLRKDVK
jgi:hypothetical protein